MRRILIGLGVALVLSVLAWQGITSAGNPDPMAAHTSRPAAVADIAVLVFREGLECILVLSAVTASMVGANAGHRRPVMAGAGLGLVATLVTWFIAAGIVSDLTANFSALHVQAATGLLAVVVLLVVMNWFFHKVYWGGWIALHNRRKKDLLREAGSAESSRRRLVWGMGLLGFSSLYREGFEVVLFLQSYRLRLGQGPVLEGVLLGALFTAVAATLTFVAHRRLPYRRMLVLTGILLGLVLLVMVGEEAQEMQLAHWLPTTNVAWLAHRIPAWLGLWFSVFPTVETLAAQGMAAAFVAGSYWLVRRTAAQQSCQADCSGEQSQQAEGHCHPLCVSATICRVRDGAGRDSR
ncbi:MAG TPA: FTR1 family protein [Bryobacteraceae bacterium]|nr:FTR1 family protein [Bryobacteraceae bacterium]